MGDASANLVTRECIRSCGRAPGVAVLREVRVEPAENDDVHRGRGARRRRGRRRGRAHDRRVAKRSPVRGPGRRHGATRL